MELGAESESLSSVAAGALVFTGTPTTAGAGLGCEPEADEAGAEAAFAGALAAVAAAGCVLGEACRTGAGRLGVCVMAG